MPSVSKGEMRFYKLRAARLVRAVPTLDLRRKQLNREILDWEESLEKTKEEYLSLKSFMDKNPHPEVRKKVIVKTIHKENINVAGIALQQVVSVDFDDIEYFLAATPPSFDIFIDVQKKMLGAEAKMNMMEDALRILREELLITTQRINLFEKRLIPEYQEQIRYIRGRLEDNERAQVIVAKIAQAAMQSEMENLSDKNQ